LQTIWRFDVEYFTQWTFSHYDPLYSVGKVCYNRFSPNRGECLSPAHSIETEDFMQAFLRLTTAPEGAWLLMEVL